MDEEILEILTSLAKSLAMTNERLDKMEHQHDRSNSPLEETASSGALSTFQRTRPAVLTGLVLPNADGAWLSETIPDRQEILASGLRDDPRGHPELPRRVAPRERPQPAAVSRPGVDFAVEVPRGRYAEAPSPEEAALKGSQFIQTQGDQYVQVRAEDGTLLGCMPSFSGDIDRVFTEMRQELSVGMLAVRAVVVPYNKGIDPFSIAGFIPGPGVQRGALSTAPVGQGANLENPDVGRRV